MGCEVEEASNGGHRDGRATLAGEEGRRWSLGVAWGASKGEIPAVMKIGEAKYCVGQVVRHRFFPFRGVIFDVDPIFANTDEWYAGNPGRDPTFEGAALLSSARGERRDRIRRLRLRAEPSAGRQWGAGAPSAGSRSLRQLREGSLPQPRRPELTRWRPISIVVIAGLDPAIHSTAANCDQRSGMDPMAKPRDDDNLR